MNKAAKEIIRDFSNRELYNYKYIPLFKCKKRYVFVMGGSGSGKSTFIAQKYITRTYKPNRRILGIRKVKDTIKESMFAELAGVIEEWGLESDFTVTVSPMQIVNKLTGTDIIFRGMDNPEKVKSIRRVTDVWIEEATELNKQDFDQLDLRLRGTTELQIIATFNPTDEEHWLNVDFWSKGNTDEVELMHSTYRDNRFIDHSQYEGVLNRLKETSPNMYKIYALGLWGSGLEGVIFKFEEIHDVPKDAEFLGYGQDFGYSNDPTTLTALYKWNGKIVLDELIYKKGLTNVYKDKKDKPNSIIGNYEMLHISKTKEIWADSSEPKSIEEIHREGYNIKPVVKGPDSIAFGINAMLQYEIIVTARSGNIKKEFRNYTWAVDKNGKPLNEPIDAFNHSIDGVRYFFMMRLSKVFRKRKVRVLN